MFPRCLRLPAGILIFPTSLDDSMLYVIVSDSSDDAAIKSETMPPVLDLSMPSRPNTPRLPVIGKTQKENRREIWIRSVNAVC